MDYSYHNHTVRCSHASGTMEEYVERAFSCGVRYFGFSDHAPFVPKSGVESGYRVPSAQAREYVKEALDLRERYRGRMEIFVGFEMEYFPKDFARMLEDVRSVGAEYLILGEHFMMDESTGGRHVMKETSDPEELKTYVRCVIEAMNTGVFTYVAHPDVLNFVGDDLLYRTEMRKLCIEGRKCGVPFEINLLGIRDRRHYPNPIFWKIAGEEGVPVTFGMDAHDAKNAFDAESLSAAKDMCAKYGLNYIGRPNLIRI